MARLQNEQLLKNILSAKTPRERLAGVTLCFLLGRFPYGFKYDMRTWGTGETVANLTSSDWCGLTNHKVSCRTVGCIAGLANFLYSNCSSINSTRIAQVLLGLNTDDFHSLFTPDMPADFDEQFSMVHREGFYTHLSHNPVQVGRVLHKFYHTGVVDWSKETRETPVRVGEHVF